MSAVVQFRPEPLLLRGTVHPGCRAIIVLPARNEEASLPSALDALAEQVDEVGQPLASETFEILLLLNNCTDGSAATAWRWNRAHPEVRLHILEIELPPQLAHVGKARRLLMDTAWQRLARLGNPRSGILSTDADTVVAPDWIAQNLRALNQAADAVGGAIWLKRDELEALPAGTRHAYLCDRRYQQLVAELEDLLDPQAGDAWPRHLDHFGASLACTAHVYARAGGLPPVSSLEDVAFVDALRRVDARLRHEPAVKVYTSLRLDGRTELGFSGQLRQWQQMSEQGKDHRVLSAGWLVHRFRTLRHLRALCQHRNVPHLTAYPAAWHARITQVHGRRASVAQFLADLDCNLLIEETFRGEREEPIARANASLWETILRIRAERASNAVLLESVSQNNFDASALIGSSS